MLIVKLSVPAPPSIVLSPKPLTVIASLPAPARIRSAPEPVVIVSLPAPPIIVLSELSPFIVLLDVAIEEKSTTVILEALIFSITARYSPPLVALNRV